MPIGGVSGSVSSEEISILLFMLSPVVSVLVSGFESGSLGFELSNEQGQGAVAFSAYSVCGFALRHIVAQDAIGLASGFGFAVLTKTTAVIARKFPAIVPRLYPTLGLGLCE